VFLVKPTSNLLTQHHPLLLLTLHLPRPLLRMTAVPVAIKAAAAINNTALQALQEPQAKLAQATLAAQALLVPLDPLDTVTLVPLVNPAVMELQDQKDPLALLVLDTKVPKDLTVQLVLKARKALMRGVLQALKVLKVLKVLQELKVLQAVMAAHTLEAQDPKVNLVHLVNLVKMAVQANPVRMVRMVLTAQFQAALMEPTHQAQAVRAQLCRAVM